jgi:hypothetical protein
VSVCPPPPSAARQRDLLFDERRDRPLSVGALTEQSSGPLRPLSQKETKYCQSYVTTDGQSASLFRCQAPIWAPRPGLYCCQTVSGFLMWGALSNERTGLSFTTAAGHCQRSFSRQSPSGLMTIFYCPRFGTPPIWRARSPYLYRPGTGWPGYTPRHWAPFSSPPVTRRATVEVFKPASTRDKFRGGSLC